MNKISINIYDSYEELEIQDLSSIDDNIIEYLCIYEDTTFWPSIVSFGYFSNVGEDRSNSTLHFSKSGNPCEVACEVKYLIKLEDLESHKILNHINESLGNHDDNI